jgi:diguanylate cyclase (GGDEF)-like protein
MSAQCPVGENNCTLLDEVGQLRARVDELRMLVVTDELTGLNNYRHLLWALDQELERLHRHGGSFCVLVLDCDNLKRINDNYGHDFGNKVLKAAGTFLQRSLRKLDVACRFGGDEFVIVAPSANLREGVALAERIRSGIAAMQLRAGEEEVTLRVSIGVDCFKPEDQLLPEQVLDRADRYLLKAKQAGKNIVCSPELPDAASSMNADEKSAMMESFGGEKT